MTYLTKSRRLPVKHRIHPGGLTEIRYSAIPLEVTIQVEPLPEVLLPGTRWLSKRREREQRELEADLAELAAITEDDATAPIPSLAAEHQAAENDSWAQRIAKASLRLMRRQSHEISQP